MRETPALILNKVEAIVDCKAGTLSELARHLGKPRQRTHEWISLRSSMPTGDVLDGMKNWASHKTLAIAMAHEHLRQRYRISFEQISERRRGVPVAGRN